MYRHLLPNQLQKSLGVLDRLYVEHWGIKKANPLDNNELASVDSGPCRTRTCDPLIMSQLL